MGGDVAIVCVLLRWTGSSWELMLLLPGQGALDRLVVVIPLAAAGARAIPALGGVRGGGIERSVADCGVGDRSWIVLWCSSASSGAVPPSRRICGASPRARSAPAELVHGGHEAPCRRVHPKRPRRARWSSGSFPGRRCPTSRGASWAWRTPWRWSPSPTWGLEARIPHPVKSDLYQPGHGRRSAATSRSIPTSLRITGPNPAAGPEWIIDSGCPEDVVKPESGSACDFDPGMARQVAVGGRGVESSRPSPRSSQAQHPGVRRYTRAIAAADNSRHGTAPDHSCARGAPRTTPASRWSRPSCALFVLGIIFTALAAASMGSLRASMNSRAEQQAIDFATEALEQARQADYYSLGHDATDVAVRHGERRPPVGRRGASIPGDGAEQLVIDGGGRRQPAHDGGQLEREQRRQLPGVHLCDEAGGHQAPTTSVSRSSPGGRSARVPRTHDGPRAS